MSARFENENLEACVFRDCALARSTFTDVNLSGAVFSNATLRQARFTNVDLSGVTIDDANIEGLTIFGHDIQALIRAQIARQA